MVRLDFERVFWTVFWGCFLVGVMSCTARRVYWEWSDDCAGEVSP